MKCNRACPIVMLYLNCIMWGQLFKYCMVNSPWHYWVFFSRHWSACCRVMNNVIWWILLLLLLNYYDMWQHASNYSECCISSDGCWLLNNVARWILMIYSLKFFYVLQPTLSYSECCTFSYITSSLRIFTSTGFSLGLIDCQIVRGYSSSITHSNTLLSG
jgi:hypothetical protein